LALFSSLDGDQPFVYHLFDMGLIFQAMLLLAPHGKADDIGGYQQVDRRHEGHSDTRTEFRADRKIPKISIRNSCRTKKVYKTLLLLHMLKYGYFMCAAPDQLNVQLLNNRQ
jgi:hypothetical protein